MGMGKASYPWVRVWVEFCTHLLYGYGYDIALPCPYPAYCRPYWCQSYAQIGAINKLSGAVAKLASINLQKWFLSPTGSIKPWFHNRGKLADVLIIPSSWGSQLGG
jgi:hypothetical protein